MKEKSSEEDDINEEEYFKSQKDISIKSFTGFWSIFIASVIIFLLFVHPNIFKISIEMFDWTYIDGVLYFK